MSSLIPMDRRGPSSSSSNGPSSSSFPSPSSPSTASSSGSSHASKPTPLRRRLSIEEDVRYQRIMTSSRRPPQPPPYQSSPLPMAEATRIRSHNDFLLQPHTHYSDSHIQSQLRGHRSIADLRADILPDMSSPSRPRRLSREPLPSYSCSVECEGVFERKLEIEHVTKRAEYRQWQTVYITLVGTALSIYANKKDRGLGKKGGPKICPDNPPWMKRGKLIQQYSLMHADAGIAADYEKRRYVIRVRAETDQFLISCIELSTYIKWLNALFSAIDVAAPLEERDFPRDQSIPRYQRIRWLRGTYANECPNLSYHSGESTDDLPASPAPIPINPRDVGLNYYEDDHAVIDDETEESVALAHGNVPESTPPTTSDGASKPNVNIPSLAPRPIHHRLSENPIMVRRMSNTDYPHDAIDYYSGKWAPYHAWTETHDLLYAKMCYSVLMFRSPRKSPFVVSKGTTWRVDWQTGQMTRVLPPEYTPDADAATPWEIIHTQNMRRR